MESICGIQNTDEPGCKCYVSVHHCKLMGGFLKQLITQVFINLLLCACGCRMTCGFPHLPPFWAHLVKLEAADRTAGVLMIPFSGCPVTPYPLTFPSEENSQWTGAAPSQTPFPLACCPPDMLESRACSWGKWGGQGGGAALRLLPFPHEF